MVSLVVKIDENTQHQLSMYDLKKRTEGQNVLVYIDKSKLTLL